MPQKIVALMGPNDCGKSSVLDGMLYKTNSHAPIGNTGTKDHIYHSMTGSPNFDHNNTDIEFVDGDYSTVFGKRAHDGKERTIFSFRSPYRYESALKVTQSTAVPEISRSPYS